MVKLRQLWKSGRNGVKEITTGEMTFPERVVTAGGVGAAVGGGLNIAIATVLTGAKAVAFVTVGKVAIVGGLGVATLACGKAFARGFIEQMQVELKRDWSGK